MKIFLAIVVLWLLTELPESLPVIGVIVAYLIEES
jgi:hypothetical protein